MLFMLVILRFSSCGLARFGARLGGLSCAMNEVFIFVGLDGFFYE